MRQPTSLEARRRLEQVFKELDEAGKVSSPEVFLRGDRLRCVRAVQALERMDTAEARALLAALAKGIPWSRQTEAAKNALDRLGKQ